MVTGYKLVCQFSLLQRLPSYLATAEKTVCDFLHPACRLVYKKWLPAKTVCMILHPAETLNRKWNQADRLQQETIYHVQQSQQEARDCRQSWQKPNMTKSLSRKQKLVDQFTSCDGRYWQVLQLVPHLFCLPWFNFQAHEVVNYMNF